MHSAAAIKMLFDLPAEIFVNEEESHLLETLTDQQALPDLPIPLLKLEPAAIMRPKASLELNLQNLPPEAPHS